jgi:hypothetical protein
MVAWDADGQRMNYADHAFAINLNPQQAAQVLKSGLPLHQEIYLRIAVHDLRSGRIGSLEVPVTVGMKISTRRQ